jgi:Ca2+-binding RTX toxin-like protein
LDKLTVTEIVGIAKGNNETALAVRNALRGLSFVAIMGLDLSGRELGLDVHNDGGGMTDKWLLDRASFIEALLEADVRHSDKAASFDHDTWIVTDRVTSRTVTLLPIGASGTDANGNPTGGTNNSAQVNRLIFGSDADEQGDLALKGNRGDDRLYGGGGADSLEGQEGDDYLEGNSGDDTLAGENGRDELLVLLRH